MNNLQSLKQFADKTNNISASMIIDKYIKSAMKSKVYYLGGQLDMKINDNISEKQIEYVLNKYVTTGPCNSWKINKHSTQYNDTLIIKQLIQNKTRNKILNGLFKSICIWIIPAAKRAKYKRKSKTFFNPEELIFHNSILN